MSSKRSSNASGHQPVPATAGPTVGSNSTQSAGLPDKYALSRKNCDRLFRFHEAAHQNYTRKEYKKHLKSLAKEDPKALKQLFWARWRALKQQRFLQEDIPEPPGKFGLTKANIVKLYKYTNDRGLNFRQFREYVEPMNRSQRETRFKAMWRAEAVDNQNRLKQETKKPEDVGMHTFLKEQEDPENREDAERRRKAVAERSEGTLHKASKLNLASQDNAVEGLAKSRDEAQKRVDDFLFEHFGRQTSLSRKDWVKYLTKSGREEMLKTAINSKPEAQSQSMKRQLESISTLLAALHSCAELSRPFPPGNSMIYSDSDSPEIEFISIKFRAHQKRSLETSESMYARKRQRVASSNAQEMAHSEVLKEDVQLDVAKIDNAEDDANIFDQALVPASQSSTVPERLFIEAPVQVSSVSEPNLPSLPLPPPLPFQPGAKEYLLPLSGSQLGREPELSQSTRESSPDMDIASLWNREQSLELGEPSFSNTKLASEESETYVIPAGAAINSLLGFDHETGDMLCVPATPELDMPPRLKHVTPPRVEVPSPLSDDWFEDIEEDCDDGVEEHISITKDKRCISPSPPADLGTNDVPESLVVDCTTRSPVPSAALKAEEKTLSGHDLSSLGPLPSTLVKNKLVCVNEEDEQATHVNDDAGTLSTDPEFTAGLSKLEPQSVHQEEPLVSKTIRVVRQQESYSPLSGLRSDWTNGVPKNAAKASTREMRCPLSKPPHPEIEFSDSSDSERPSDLIYLSRDRPLPNRAFRIDLSTKPVELLQENLGGKPFHLAVAALVSFGSSYSDAFEVFNEIMKDFPTPSALDNEDLRWTRGRSGGKLISLLRPLTNWKRRANAIVGLARAWIKAEPSPGEIRSRSDSYPDLNEFSRFWDEIVIFQQSIVVELNKDFATGMKPKAINDLKLDRETWDYVLDSFRIFCCLETINDEQLDRPFEWQRVLPKSDHLQGYLKWRWLKQGWDWNKRTGDIKPAKDSEMSGSSSPGLESSTNTSTLRSSLSKDLRTASQQCGSRRRSGAVDYTRFYPTRQSLVPNTEADYAGDGSGDPDLDDHPTDETSKSPVEQQGRRRSATIAEPMSWKIEKGGRSHEVYLNHVGTEVALCAFCGENSTREFSKSGLGQHIQKGHRQPAPLQEEQPEPRLEDSALPPALPFLDANQTSPFSGWTPNKVTIAERGSQPNFSGPPEIAHVLDIGSSGSAAMFSFAPLASWPSKQIQY